MKEYSYRTVRADIAKYLTECTKEGWDVFHIQKGSGASPLPWYIILVRDSEEVSET